MRTVKAAFHKKVKENSQLSTEISNWVEDHLRLKHGTIDNDLDDVYRKIYEFYDFIDCSLIVAMCGEFLNNEELMDKLKTYSEHAKVFRFSKPISELKQKLRKVYGPFRRNLDSMPLICIELHNPWNDININGLYILIKKLLPKEIRESLMKSISIDPGSVIIKLNIDIPADRLIEYAVGKLQFMHLIGIFSLYINDHAVLQEDENMNFTFELALLEAVTAGHNEAVEFLLQLETVNINHTNEEGKTALMLACEGGHADIVHSLLSAGANVNLQDNNGCTALMRASEHNHISIINMLLQANANPHLKTSNGSNALMIASFHGNYEVAELMNSIGVDYKYQRKDGWNAFMVACRNGHTQIVELLLKEQVDLNVQKKDGANAFMVACENGHTQIVELLLKEQVDPNVQDKDGWNAFMVACENGHTQIVELLLKEQVDLNVQKKTRWMLECFYGGLSKWSYSNS